VCARVAAMAFIVLFCQTEQKNNLLTPIFINYDLSDKLKDSQIFKKNNISSFIDTKIG
jgi:hypothetical protein